MSLRVQVARAVPVLPQVQSPSIALRPWNQMSRSDKAREFLSDYFYYLHQPSVFNPSRTIESFRVKYLTEQFLNGNERVTNFSKLLIDYRKAVTILANGAFTGASVAGRVFLATVYTVAKVAVLVLFNYLLYVDFCKKRQLAIQMEMALRSAQPIQVQQIQVQAPSIPPSLPPVPSQNLAPEQSSENPAPPRIEIDIELVRERALSRQLRRQDSGLDSPRAIRRARQDPPANAGEAAPADALLREIRLVRERLRPVELPPRAPEGAQGLGGPQPLDGNPLGRPINSLADLLAARRIGIAGHIANRAGRRGSLDSDGGF